jgi:phenylacetate-CoA ligase
VDRSLWNEPIETMAPSELRRVEAPLLAEQIAYVYATSPYYRQKLDEARVSPDAVTCVEALEALPFTEKSDITSAQREGAMFGPHQCARFEDIVRIVGTGGTSGQPTRIGWTAGDTEVYNEMGARAFWANGCRPHDFVVNCFNYSLYAGGIMDHMAFETLGAGILPYGVGRSDRLLELFSGFPRGGVPGSYTLYATPSYAIRLHELAQARVNEHRYLCGIKPGALICKSPRYAGGLKALVCESHSDLPAMRAESYFLICSDQLVETQFCTHT